MSKLNPQKATAYVGPGVLRKGGKITPVPNGPLIKKKGPYAGSTLKSGGAIKKAQAGVKATKDSTAYFNKEKESRFKEAREAGKLGFRKSADDEMKKGMVAGENAMRQKRKGMPGYDKNGYPLKKKAQNGTSQYSDPKPLFDKINKSKDSVNNAMLKLKEEKFKSKMKYSKSKLKNEQSIMNTKKAKAGAMIKRADGSYSKRGLWDNIRANKGSGKKPTAEMLKQERKIKAKK